MHGRQCLCSGAGHAHALRLHACACRGCIFPKLLNPCSDASEPALCAVQDRVYLSDDYKRTVLEHMSIEQLIDTLMINPTVHLSPSYRDTGLRATYTFQPLSNLVYTRDQQITGCKGIVMCRLRSQQRQLESDLMRFCFAKLGAPLLPCPPALIAGALVLPDRSQMHSRQQHTACGSTLHKQLKLQPSAGLPVVGEIREPGHLEGGDFFPAGQVCSGRVMVHAFSEYPSCMSNMWSMQLAFSELLPFAAGSGTGGHWAAQQL